VGVVEVASDAGDEEALIGSERDATFEGRVEERVEPSLDAGREHHTELYGAVDLGFAGHQCSPSLMATSIISN